MLAACLVAALTSGAPSLAADDAKAAKTELPADLGLVPPDAAAVLCLQVGPYWKGAEAESLKKITQAHPIVVTWWTRDLDKQIGLSMADIERVVAVVPDFTATDEFAVLLTTRKPFDRVKVLGVLVPQAREMKVEAKKYYVSDKSPFGVQVVNERLLLVGLAKGVRGFLSRPDTKLGGALRPALATAADKHLLIAGVNPAAFLSAVKSSGEKGKAFVPLIEAKSWRITVDAAKELRINLRLDFADEKAAKQGQTALKGIVEPLIGYFSMGEKQMGAFLQREADKYKGIMEISTRLPNVLKSTRAALEQFKSEQKGSTVQGTLSIETGEPATSFVLLLSMMPRAAKE
jgi:hypothetical protein